MRLPLTLSSLSKHRVTLGASIAIGLLLCVPGELAAKSAASSPGNSVVLDKNIAILISPGQPGPVKLAAEDLESDLTKVFGAGPRIIRHEDEAGGMVIMIGRTASGAPPDHSSAPESFSITSGTSTVSGGRRIQVVRLDGSDMLGTIYSIYQFSQQYLGIDPMYYWTDHEPMRRIAIRLPNKLDDNFPPPVFRYRGFFINDEDLLTGWAPGKTGERSGISLAVWNKICETILRLKGNMVVAGTFPFPDDSQDRIVAERGLCLGLHHATPLGVNFSRWPAGVPYNFTSDPQYLENAWRNAVAAYPKSVGDRILWAVGLRGLTDQPYSAMDPTVRGKPKALGRLIDKAIRDQMRIVRAKYPRAVFVTNLWMEGDKLMRQGDLVIPPDVIPVWADAGYGDMQDYGRVRRGQGAYIHVAMYNTIANQLSELVPVSRLFSSLGRYQKAGATSYLLVNTSDLRPVTMGASAVMDFGWTGSAIGSSDEFYRTWSREEFGAKAAPAVAAVYKAYFRAPAIVPSAVAARYKFYSGNPEAPGSPFATPTPYGDNYYHTIARAMMLNTMVQWPVYTLPGSAPFWTRPTVSVPYIPGWAEKQAKIEIASCGAAKGRWDAVWKQAKTAERLVPMDRRQFYQSGILTMIAINRDSNEMLLLLSQSINALNQGDMETARLDARQAILALDRLRISEARAEHGKWKGWYRGDWLTGVPRTQQE
ncbi:MAG: glycosyl hydrolase 115 family protein, partial [Acidobacteriaceae bacterium]